MTDHASTVPPNENGASSDTSHEVTLTDVAAAEVFFQTVRQRLLDVNRWHELAGKGSAEFQLVDAGGKPAHRAVRVGDFFKIDIPGPGTVAGEGYDWVRVEAIDQTKSDDGEMMAIRVRPANDPNRGAADIAHFFSDEATSTFSVIRLNKTIKAVVQGRNEKPNTQTGNVVDKVRNTVIAAGAMMGLNKPQWRSLVKGLLS